MTTLNRPGFAGAVQQAWPGLSVRVRSVGRVLTRRFPCGGTQNGGAGLTETFNYDGLNRLKTYNIVGGPSFATRA